MGKKVNPKGEKKDKNRGKKEDLIKEDKTASAKKIAIYRKALKRTLASGTENIVEDTVLIELRNTLNITLNQHQQLLDKITAEITSMEKLQKDSKQKISRVEKQILDLNKKGIETKIIENLLIRAHEAKSEKSFAEFDTYIAECTRITKNLQRKSKIQGQIDKVKKIITKVEKIGANVKKEKNLLRKAEAAMESGKFAEASKYATEARKFSTEHRKFGTAKKQIERFSQDLKKLESEMDMRECKEAAAEAEKALKNNKYSKVTQIITESKKILQSSKRHHTATEKVYKIHEMVKQAKEAGLDLQKIKPMTHQLEKYLKNKEYNNLSKQSTIIRAAINEDLKLKNANEKILEGQQAIKEAKSVGSSVKTATRLLGQAKRALKTKKYPNVHKYARSAIKVAKDGKITAIRRKVSSVISSAKFLIKDVADFGVDVIEAKKLLVSAEKEYNNKNYEEAQNLAEQAEKTAKETFDKKKGEYLKKAIKERLINVKFVFNELEEMNVEYSDIKKLFENAQLKFDEGDYKSSEKLLKDAEVNARKALDEAKLKQRKNKVKNELDECKKLIKNAKYMNIDTFDFENLLEEANKLFKEKKYEEVLEKTKEFKSSFNSLKNDVLKSRTEKLIKSTLTLIDDAKNLGADLTEAEQIMDEVKSSFKGKDYARAEELVKECQQLAKKAWSDYRSSQANRALETAQRIMEEAQSAGIDISDAQEMLENANSMIEEENFEDAEELINKAKALERKKLDGHRLTKAQNTVNDLKEVYVELKDSDANAAELKNLITEAEKNIELNDFEAVTEYIKQAESITSRFQLDEKLEIYSERINKSKEFITKTKESGFETQDLEELVSEVESIYNKEDIEDFNEHLDQLKDKTGSLIDANRKKVSTEVLSGTQESVGKSREIGANVSKAENFLNKAENIISEEEFDFVDAEELLSKANMEAKRSWVERKSELTSEAVSSAKNMIQESKEMGADVSEAEQLLSEAEDLFKDEDFNAIDDHLKRVNEVIESSKAQKKVQIANEEITSTKELLAETRELGVDVSDAEEILSQAEGMFKDEDFDTLDEYVKKAESALKASQMEFQREEKSKTISSTKAKIDEGRDKGAEVTEAEDLLKQAENMLMSEDNFDAVEALIQQSQTSLASSWGQYNAQKLIDDISKMNGTIEKYRGMGLNVSKAEELIHQAEIEYKNERLDNVEELLDKANTIVEQDYEEQFSKRITLLISDIKTQIKTAKDMELDVTAAEDILKKAILEFEKKNYSKAEEIARKARDIVSDLIESYDKEQTQKLIERLEGLILDAKSFNIDVTPAERLFRQAKALYKTSEFKNSREYVIKAENLLNSLAKKHIKDVHPHLTAEIKDVTMQAHKWNKMQVSIYNDGKIKAQDVELGLKGNFDIKGKKKIEAIDPEQQVDIELGFNPNDAGDVPIKVLLKCYRPFVRDEYKFSSDTQVVITDPGSFTVQDVFLIYIDGCLVLHKSREYREMVDEDIFSGMLVAVQNFVTDSFRRTETQGLKRLDFGVSKILLENGPKFFIALVMEGDEPGMLPLLVIETIKEIQSEFGEILEDWDGNLEKLNGIEKYVDKLLHLEVVPGTGELRVPDKEGSTVLSMQSMMSDVRELGVETSEVESALQLAESKLESSDYETVWKHVEEANDKIRKVRRDYFYDDIKDAISTVKGEITEAKSAGVDVGEAEELFGQMKDMVKNEEFNEALDNAKKAIDIAQGSRKNVETMNALKKMDDNITGAGELGIDIPSTDEQKAQIGAALEAKDFDKAITIINEVNKTLQEALSKISIESLNIVTEQNKNLDEVKNLGMDVAESQELLDSAKQSIKGLDLGKALELFHQAENKITTDKNQFYQTKASEVISTAKETLTDLQKMNIDTIAARKLLMDAESNLNNKNYVAAHQIASSLFEQLEQTEHTHKSRPILDNIITLEAMVEKAKVRGVENAKIEPIEELIKQGRAELDSKNYRNAEELINNANTKANESFEFLKEEKDVLRAQIDTTMSVISSTKESGMDTSEVEKLMGRMKDVLDGGDLEATKRYMENVQTMLEDIQVPYMIQELNREIKKLENYLNETKEKGIDTSEAEHLTENAKAVLETEDLDAVQEYLKKARDNLDGVNQTHRAIVISETIKSTYNLIDEIKELGAEVDFARDLLKQAEDMLKIMNIDSAESLVTNALSTANDVKKEFLSKEATEKIGQAEGDISKAKEDGIKTVDAERLLSQAKEFFDSQDFENSKQYAINASQLIENIKEEEKGAKIKEEFNYTQQLYMDIKNKGANVTQADAPIMQAQASLNNKDYEMAQTYTDNARNILNDIKRPFSIKLASTALERARNMITVAQKYGAEVTEAQNLFNEAQQANTNQDYDTTEEKAKKAERLASEAQEKYYDNYISNEIKTLKDNIDKLKHQGYDIINAEELLSDINSLYLEKNFKEIGDKIKNIRELLVKLEEDRYIERANDAIAFSKAMVKYIKNNIKDIGARIKQPENLVKTAEDEFKSKDYLRAEQTALESQRAVENIKHSNLEQFLFVFKQLQAEEMLNQTKTVISNIKKLGIDLADSDELIKQAEEAFKNEETYNKAQELLTEAKIKAHEKENKFQEKNASSAISAAESLIITLRQNGVDVDPANKFLNQAKTALEIREFKKSILFAGKAKFTAKKLMGDTPGETGS